MFYPKADICPFNTDEPNCTHVSTEQPDAVSVAAKPDKNPCSNSEREMMTKIQETAFALIDLNLFLDTHPDCAQALELYTKLAATLKSLKADYQSKFGPLVACESSNNAPFEWVADGYKWPWEI